MTAAGRGSGGRAPAFAPRGRGSSRPTSTSPASPASGRRRAGSTCAERGGRGDRARARPARCPLQLRRPRHPGTVLDHVGRRQGLPATSTSTPCTVRSAPFCPACWIRRRLDRQHRLGRLQRQRHPQPLRLWRLQGGGDRPHQVGGGRLLGKGVRCNAICPGTIASLARRPHRHLEQVEGDPTAGVPSFIDRQPMGRLGKPQEIADLAVYLASDESASRPARSM